MQSNVTRSKTSQHISGSQSTDSLQENGRGTLLFPWRMMALAAGLLVLSGIGVLIWRASGVHPVTVASSLPPASVSPAGTAVPSSLPRTGALRSSEVVKGGTAAPTARLARDPLAPALTAYQSGHYTEAEQAAERLIQSLRPPQAPRTSFSSARTVAALCADDLRPDGPRDADVWRAR